MRSMTRVLADAHESIVGERGRLFNGVRAEVGEFLVLQVFPHLLDGIKVNTVYLRF